MDLKTPLSGVLSNALKLDNPKIDSLLDESKSPAEIEAALSSVFAEHIEKVLAPERLKNEQQKLYGIKEGAKIYQKPLQDLLGSKSEGQDLLNELTQKMQTSTPLPEDQVIVHPLYRQAVTEKETAIQEAQRKLAEQEASFNKRTSFATLFEKNILPAVAEAGYVLPENKTQAAILQGLYRDELGKYDYETNAAGETFVKENGELKKDIHSNPMTLKAFAAQKATEYGFDLKNNNGGKSPQNGQNQNNGGSGTGAKKFKTDAEFTAYIQDKSIPVAERDAAIKEHYAAK